MDLIDVQAFARLLDKESIEYRHEVWVPIRFLDLEIPDALRADFVVADEVVIEMKPHAEIHASHEAQILNYLRLSRKPVGFLVHFGAPRFRDGIRRYVRSPTSSRLREFEISRPWMRGLPAASNEET